MRFLSLCFSIGNSYSLVRDAKRGFLLSSNRVRPLKVRFNDIPRFCVGRGVSNRKWREKKREAWICVAL